MPAHDEQVYNALQYALQVKNLITLTLGYAYSEKYTKNKSPQEVLKAVSERPSISIFKGAPKKNHYEYLMKVVVVGDSNDGIQQLVASLTGLDQSNTSTPNLRVVDAQYNQIPLKIQVWHCECVLRQSQHPFFTGNVDHWSRYARGASDIIIAFNLDNENSFKAAVKSFYKDFNLFGEEQATCRFVGVRSKENSKNTKVDKDELYNFCKEESISCFEIDLDTCNNIDNPLSLAIEEYPDKLEKKLRSSFKPAM